MRLTMLEHLRYLLRRTHLLRQSFSDISQRISRAARNNEFALLQQLHRATPFRDGEECIDADQEEQSITLLQTRLEAPHRVDRVAHQFARCLNHFGRFEKRRNKILLTCKRKRQHREAMIVSGDLRFAFEWLNVGGNEVDASEIETLGSRARNGEMPPVYWIEATAVDCDVHRSLAYRK